MPLTHSMWHEEDSVLIEWSLPLSTRETSVTPDNTEGGVVAEVVGVSAATSNISAPGQLMLTS